MAVTTRSDVIVPELLEKAIQGAFSGARALYGTPAAIVKTGLPGDKKGGDKVKIPYFGTLGELEDVAEGDSLTPAALSMTSEEASVVHSGKAFEATHWSQLAAADDPYQEAARQFVEMVMRRGDKALIDAAIAPGLPAGMVLDVYNASTPRTLDYDLVVDGKMCWGDEQDDIALMVVHSKVLGDLLKLKDSTGRPLLTIPAEGQVHRLVNIPLIVSDRLAPTADSPAKYTTALLKRGALAFWFQEQARVATDRDILADSDIAAVHIYWAAHRYSRLPGRTKGGVVLLKHN